MFTREILSLIAIMAACTAHSADIANLNDLRDNSTLTAQGYELIPEGEYIFIAPVDTGGSGLVFNGYSLNVDATSMGATGLAVGTLQVAAPGSIEALGGSAASVYGLSATSLIVSPNTYAQTVGRGGSGANAYGIDAGSIVSGSGYMYGYGGAGTDAYGINAGSITMSGGAQMRGEGGGSGTVNSYGINAGTLSQSGYSILTASGGEGTNAYGINAVSWTVSNPAVYNSVNGGAGNDAAGVHTGSLDFGGNYLYAFGGQGTDAAGIYVTGNATQTSGHIQADGGGAAGAHGMDAGTFTQQAGSLGTRSTEDYAYGLKVRGDYQLSAGATLTAEAGYYNHAYGVYVGGRLDLAGRVELHRESRLGTSIFVDSGQTVSIRSSAVIAPVVHLTKDKDHDSGLIASGARVDPYFIEHRNMRVGDTYEEYVFIDTGLLAGGSAGNISGYFANESGGLAIEYVLYKDVANGQYLISFGRVIETPDLINMVPCENARRLMALFDDLYDPDDVLAARVMSRLDHAGDLSELYRISAHIGRTLTPTAYAKLTGTQLRTVELLHDSVFRRLDGLHERWETWAEALHQRSSHFSARCAEFDTPKEKITGVSVGAGRDFGSLSVAGAFGYARGTYKSNYTDTGVDNFGVTLGAKLKEPVPPGE